MHLTRSRWILGLLLALAFAAGGTAPLHADSGDALVRQIEKLTEAVKEIGRREVKAICECRCGG